MALLKTPLTLHGMTLPNRLVMPPMATAKSSPDGEVTEALCAYYAEKSAGGYLGLVITEHSYVSPLGKASRGQMSASRDADIEGLGKIVEALHRNGVKCIAQINHAGSCTTSEINGGEVLAPSAVKNPRLVGAPLPRAMTAEEIRAVVEDFAAAAARVKAAGFDGVEIHSAHSYLLNQFYSPYSNRRTDAYTGATLAGRIRLHLEVIEAVRGAVGADYTVALRLGACDYLEGGSTPQDSAQAALAFERAGVDLIDVTGGLMGYVLPDRNEPGYFSDLSEAIREKVSGPVILTGGVTEAAQAEALLQAGKADLIGVGRAVARDSLWPKNAMESLN